MTAFVMPGDDPEEKKNHILFRMADEFSLKLNNDGVDWTAYHRLVNIPDGSNVVVIDDKTYTWPQARERIKTSIQNWFLVKFANFFTAVSKYSYETRPPFTFHHLYSPDPSKAAETTFMGRAKRMVQILWRRNRRER